MSIEQLRDEEIIFGTVFNDGNFSSLLPVLPTAEQLRLIWSRHDNCFAHNVCEDCGHRSYAYSDRLQEDPQRPGYVRKHETFFYCPNCGSRKGYGGSYMRSQAIMAAIRDELGNMGKTE